MVRFIVTLSHLYSIFRDIDYEYPDTSERGEGLALLLASLREAFDELAISNDDKVPYQITVRPTKRYFVISGRC